MKRFEIAGVRFALEIPTSAAESIQTVCAARYGRFMRATGPADYSFRCRNQHCARHAPVTGKAVRTGSGEFVAEGAEPFGRLNPFTRRGEFLVDPGLHALDVLLRAAVNLELLARGGCLFHAAGIVLDHRAYLFPGPSGAGKSTLAALAKASLSDDLCAVIPGESGWIAHATPWRTGRAISAPLAGIFALARGEQVITRLSQAAGVRHLVSHIALAVDETETRAAAFYAAGRIAAATPFGRLAFTPRSDIDSLLRSGWLGP